MNATSSLRNLALLALLTAGCAKAPASEQPGPSAELAGFVLRDVPKDMAHPTFVDFGGKVHLVGYNIEPEGIVRPGSKAKLTLFWHSRERLGPGWNLFTHLDAPWLPSKNLDDAGPLRKAVSLPDGSRGQVLGPSLWEPGRVYVDEIEVEIDKNVDSAEVTVLAGIWHDRAPDEAPSQDDAAAPDRVLEYPGLRLQILSGPSDGQERAVVVHIPTGRVPQREDAKASAAKRRSPPGPEPRRR